MKSINYLKWAMCNIFLLCLLVLPKITFAAEPLVCIYEGGVYASSTMLIQSPDGKFSVKTNSDDNAILEDSDWYTPSNDYGVYIEWDSKYYKNGVLTDCPAYTRYKFTSRNDSYYTFYFYDDKNWNHLDYPLNDKHNLEIDENDYMESFEGNYSNEVSSKEWLKVCSYNDGENSEEIKLYFNRDDMIMAEDSSLIYKVTTDFSLNDVLNYYDRTSGSCPTLYANNNCFASIGNTFCYVEYSMGKSFYNSDEDKPTYNGGDDEPDTPVEEEEDEPRLNYNSICANEGPRKVAKIIGYVIKIAQWLAPLLIIVFGMIEFGKAVVSSDDKSMSKSVSSLIKKIILGVSVFLIPTLITAVLNLIQVSNNIEESSNFAACTKCLFDPFNSCDQQKTGGGGNNTNTHSQK